MRAILTSEKCTQRNRRVARGALLLLGLVLACRAAVSPASAACLASGKNCVLNTATNDRLCCPGMVCGAGNVCQPGCRINGQFYRAGTINPANVCQSCQPGASTTSWRPVTNGTACNDGNACTQTDRCQAGSCAGTNPVVCAVPDQCHTNGTCNPATGICSNPAAPEGRSCNDGNACTQTDTCTSGNCVGSTPVVCLPLDQCHVAGACNPANGSCSNPNAAEGTGCNDGNACTQSDTCAAGSCTGSNPVTCTALDQCHVAGTCNPTDGTCSDPFASPGTGCDDGDACTSPDACQSGTCSGPIACDKDGDGWTPAQGDCCETTADCVYPTQVNPGAFEIVGDGQDDDCNIATPDSTAAAACSASPDFSALTALQLAQAMDLCRTTTTNPPLASRTWGLISVSLLRPEGTVPVAGQAADLASAQTAVLANYGNVVVPNKFATMAGMSTGMMRDKSDAGWVLPVNGTDHGWPGNPPAAYLLAHGGALPSGSNCGTACPIGDEGNDGVNLRITLRVPTNAVGFSYDFRFFTAEYATYTCTVYNDYHLALLTSTAAGLPADKNIAVDASGNPMSVNNFFVDVCAPKICYTCPAGTADLAGTGMDDVQGGGTRWRTVSAPVVPGETMVLDLMLFDVEDRILDTVVLLDNFRWTLAH